MSGDASDRKFSTGATPRRESTGGTPIIPAGDRACVWMQAGVIAYWLCEYDYRCERCPLDGALRHLHPVDSAPPLDLEPAPNRSLAAQPDAMSTATDALPTPVAEAPRRDSADCGAAADLLEVALPQLDPMQLYHPNHTWARVESTDRVRIGLDSFAAHIAGAPRSVVLVGPGAHLQRGHACAWLDEPGGTLGVVAPLSGVVLEVNPRLSEAPATVTDDPSGDGWLYVLQASDLAGDLKRLETAARFAPRLERDVSAWRRRVLHATRGMAPALGTTLADGGRRVRDVGEWIGARRRVQIAALFLGSSRMPR